ncbi:DUF4010 domain-containing protein [Herbaspirillum sp. ST 5-3]|uniref:MgtC/SapB family protein n=1 Tax=Oxalobacteraceae TaxID=75682 RepID=UPI0010A2EC3E|nr:DUF4010 domain-containing protein [Herbaspirillum sp. ST 5-3]
MNGQNSLLIAFSVAISGGLLVGLDRERHKGTGPHRSLAGVRTFALAGVAGAVARAFGDPWLVAVGAAMVAVLIAIGYWRERSDAPGITTELALFVTYLLGAGAVEHAQLASGAFVVVAGLLASKTRLHRFATEVLTAEELSDGLILAGAALVIFPLVPNRPMPLLANANPHHLWRLIVLLMALQAAGHIAQRAAGRKLGLALAGLASGLVSSTSTIAAMGARARKEPDAVAACVSGALFSNVSSMTLLLSVAAAINPGALQTLWPLFAAGISAGLAVALLSVYRQGSGHAEDAPPTQVFSIGHATGFAVLLTTLTGAITLATEHFGRIATEVGVALAATVDLQAPVASLLSLASGGAIDASAIAFPLLLAISVNAAAKICTAWATGGKAFAARLAPGLFVTIAAMWLVLLWQTS